jgi:DNA-directed RNA polymerase subunit RPC12/RpoP
MKCFYCKSNVVWQSDFSTEDYGIEQRDGIVSNYVCFECDSEYQTIRWLEEDEY